MSLAWGGFRNGQIPRASLLLVDGHYWQPDAGRAFIRMRADLLNATGAWLTQTETYRTVGIPSDQYKINSGSTSDKTSNQWFQVGRRNRHLTPSAARPGTSNHGWARAGDLSGYGNIFSPSWRWLVKNAGRYGFSWTTGKASNERWHWEYVGRITTADNGSAPLNNRKEFDMTAIAVTSDTKVAPKYHGDFAIFVAGQHIMRKIGGIDAEKAIFGPVIEATSDGRFQNILADLGYPIASWDAIKAARAGGKEVTNVAVLWSDVIAGHPTKVTLIPGA